MTDPPFTKLDLLSCRNLLIYLEPELQRRLLSAFHYSLNPGGVLLLGTSETVGTAPDLFAPLAGDTRFFRRNEPAPGAPPAELPGMTGRRRSPEATVTPYARQQSDESSLQSVIDGLLLQDYAPAAVVVTEAGDIVHVSGKTGQYLEPAAGKANLNLFAMAREGLDHALPGALRRAVRQGSVVKLDRVRVPANGGTQEVDVTVRPLPTPAAVAGMVLVVFRDGARSSAASHRAAAAARRRPMTGTPRWRPSWHGLATSSRRPARRCRPHRRS